MRDLLKMLAVAAPVVAGVSALHRPLTAPNRGPMTEHINACRVCLDTSGSTEGGTPPLGRCKKLNELIKQHVDGQLKRKNGR
jgi:hypothetical protein